MQFSTIMVVLFAMASSTIAHPVAEGCNKSDGKVNGGDAGGSGSGSGAGSGAGGAGGAGGDAGGSKEFGTCTPTMDFQLGRTGRKATEGTFLPTDSKVAQGQQDALNPNIITNRICDQLTNVCGASEAGKKKCLDAKAQVLAAGSKDKSMADLFNKALGF